MRRGLTKGHVLIVWTLACVVMGVTGGKALRKEGRCMRHYYVHTIRHPTKNCQAKHVLLSKCQGFCSRTWTEPRITFSPVLYRPFNYHCKCCKDSLSVMKAVRLNCTEERHVFATYRYIIRCRCKRCSFNRW